MKSAVLVMILLATLLTGCENLRFAPTQAQKQNTWLHSRTAIAAAETARQENTSAKLRELTRLGELQSRAFVSYYGLPKQFPSADTAEQILDDSSFELAHTALTQSVDRPDSWQLADSAIDLGIGIFALFGGVYGVRVAGFLKQARGKSQALKEVVEGNELFKKQHNAYVSAFKQAHEKQSSQTRGLVAEIKAS